MGTAEAPRSAAAIAAILFDKDGTLIGYDASWGPVNRELAAIASQGDAELANRLLSSCGMDPLTGHVMPDSLLAAGNTVQIAEGLIAAGSPCDVSELTKRLDQLFTNAAEKSVAVTDLKAFFARLKGRGFKLGIASSDNEASILKLARRFGFEADLDFVAGYDSGHGTKPQPGMVLGFCQTLGLAPERVAVVGDNNHDLHMGRHAGAGLRIAVLTGTGSKQSLSADCDYCFDDITGLEDLLPQRPAS
ncbi:phosphoglycolate phosphatase [Rhizobium skierniewicense]|uniref:Phosphoglycolate phosphatase n=1 Tax=Rhizobium skierniewicense TaxID=984260 RepID=A0A7W6C8Q0_9HYPH|nr:HAD family hydrolase [Rhizobium skierniewicense]MBB3944924.1 phosphoglycolate phosphatase [Rhizobium skierniewicense]